MPLRRRKPVLEFIRPSHSLNLLLRKWLAAVIPSLLATSAVAADETGRASVVDGDTLEIHGTRFGSGVSTRPRPTSFAATPVPRTRCGAKAANALHDFIGGRIVSCVEIDRDRYRRSVAVCSAGGVDLADWLVSQGLALDRPQYSQRAYAEVEHDAQREKRGMWKGSFVQPWRYRSCLRSQAMRPAACPDEAG
jgi:endonuclease YncB( thermonuclease family)